MRPGSSSSGNRSKVTSTTSALQAVLARLQYQAGHAKVWRDAVCTWFLHKSGIADNEGRVGNYPNRFEAEAFTPKATSRRTSRPGKRPPAASAPSASIPPARALSMKYDGKAGWFDLNVSYFDENDGASKFRLLVADQVVDEWTADDTLPDNKPNGHTSTRHQTGRVALAPGRRNPHRSHRRRRRTRGHRLSGNRRRPKLTPTLASILYTG